MASTDIIRLFENTTIEEIPEDHEVAYNVLKRRVDDLSKICSTARFSPVVGKAAKNIAKLLYGAPLSDFDQSIQVATREVINELQGLCMKTQLQTNPRVNECNVDELRRKIVKLYVSFWGSKDEEPGFVKRIRHRCRHDMAVGLLTHYYHRNFGTCSIVARNTIYSKRNILSNNDLFRETIFRYIELLQQIQRKKDTSEKKRNASSRFYKF